MGFKQTKCWYIECDKCKVSYVLGDGFNAYFDTLKEAKEEIDMDTDNNLWERKGNKVLCYDCRDAFDEENVE